MKKFKSRTALMAVAMMILGLCGCGKGLDDGQKRLEQIAKGETTLAVVAPQTVAVAPSKKSETADEATTLNIDPEKKLLESFTTEAYVPQEIPKPMEITGDSVDLTQMSATVCYAQVLDILSYPDKYLGKKITMGGWFSIYESPETGMIYFACVIPDATQCCANGIEFICKDARNYPEDYPELGTDIRVAGTFETYEEDGYLYCRLKDATMDVTAQD
ncbi:MAG: hypothetical protein IK125_05545 [Lachnospiraceae bacterium]|nr:hypothetical protein [Lachnospiraceae bacterium]